MAESGHSCNIHVERIFDGIINVVAVFPLSGNLLTDCMTDN